MPKITPGITGLHEILGRIYRIEEPYWRPSILETKNLNKCFQWLTGQLYHPLLCSCITTSLFLSETANKFLSSCIFRGELRQTSE